METVQAADRRVRIRVENIGGIDTTEVEFEPGVNVLTGRNASNRTSLLQAIMAVLGSDRASLKGDADEGRVELELGDETYERTITRVDGDLVFSGTPYAADPTVADLFAFLLESNAARQAVARGDDLREVIMRPVDTETIQDEIEQLESRKRELKAELGERERLTDNIVAFEEERADLQRQFDEKQGALEEKRAALDDADAGIEETRTQKADLESHLAELRERRSTLEDVRFRIETETETAQQLREELERIATELESYDEAQRPDTETVDQRLDELREQKRSLDTKITQLQTIITFNQELLEGEGIGGTGLLGAESESTADVTSRLLPDGESFVCWTCGEEATRRDLEETLDGLREWRLGLVQDRKDVTTELADVKRRKEAFEKRATRRSELEQRHTSLETELTGAEEEIESLERRREQLATEIEQIEDDVESLRHEKYDELVELHKETNTLEVAIERLESAIERTDEELASTRERLDELEELEAELADVQDQLEEARTRIERLEDEAIAAFNDHMGTVLEVLDYENIERIWIERTERPVRDGRRNMSKGFFDLHVVRSMETGAVYEDTVAHLSESEREVTGLVFALAGYLAHDVHEAMPFILLDSIEAIDSNRIATLVTYLADFADYLVVALLPEDARFVDERYPRITEI